MPGHFDIFSPKMINHILRCSLTLLTDVKHNFIGNSILNKICNNMVEKSLQETHNFIGNSILNKICNNMAEKYLPPKIFFLKRVGVALWCGVKYGTVLKRHVMD